MPQDALPRPIVEADLFYSFYHVGRCYILVLPECKRLFDYRMIVHMVALGPVLLLREIQLNQCFYQIPTDSKVLIHPLNLFSLA